jgi:hypothetical protein
MFGQKSTLGIALASRRQSMVGYPALRLRFCRRRKEATEPLLGFHASHGADGGRGRAAEGSRLGRRHRLQGSRRGTNIPRERHPGRRWLAGNGDILSGVESVSGAVALALREPWAYCLSYSFASWRVRVDALARANGHHRAPAGFVQLLAGAASMRPGLSWHILAAGIVRA